MKRNESNKVPSWLNTSLQGLTYWVGYKRALYRGYPLSESALSTELRSLIHANLPDELYLKCEVTYAKLTKGKKRSQPIQGNQRVDFVVASLKIDLEKKNGKVLVPEFLIEVKRSNVSHTSIQKDLLRLAAYLDCKKIGRAFLVILSESHRNNHFITANGNTKAMKKKIRGYRCAYITRKTLKAASEYGNKDSANYATIIEVISDV